MTTNFSEIEFNKEWHTYTLDGHKLASVTSLVNKLKAPFDRDYWSQRKARERGVSPEVILKEWDDKAQASRERGTKVHAYIEQVLRGNSPADDPFLALNQRLPEMDAFDRLWGQIGLSAQAVQVEWIIGDAALGVAGTTDALLWSNQTKHLHLWDWKTGSKFNLDNRFQSLSQPFDDLDECEFNLYSLQLSVYRLILERNTDLDLSDNSYLVHLAGDGTHQVHKALDLRERSAAWLEAMAGTK